MGVEVEVGGDSASAANGAYECRANVSRLRKLSPKRE